MSDSEPKVRTEVHTTVALNAFAKVRIYSDPIAVEPVAGKEFDPVVAGSDGGYTEKVVRIRLPEEKRNSAIANLYKGLVLDTIEPTEEGEHIPLVLIGESEETAMGILRKLFENQTTPVVISLYRHEDGILSGMTAYVEHDNREVAA
jgi:hypothetical protein